MSDEPSNAESNEDFLKDILAGLEPDEWSAEEIAAIERALKAGDYDFPKWMSNLPGFVNISQKFRPKD